MKRIFAIHDQAAIGEKLLLMQLYPRLHEACLFARKLSCEQIAVRYGKFGGFIAEIGMDIVGISGK